MADETGLKAGARIRHGRSSRKRHPLRWILAGIPALVALAAVAVVIVIKQPAPPPLTLPSVAVSAPSGPVSGTWQVASGSVAGFRVAESAFGISNDVVGRTTAVTGTIIVSGGQVTHATFRIALAGLRVGGKTEPQLASSLDTRKYSAGTFALAHPVLLAPVFASGATIRITAAGELAMNGVAHDVQVTISARRDGPALQAAGSIPVLFPEWGIKRPAGFGVFGSLAGHGTAEFLLILRRR